MGVPSLEELIAFPVGLNEAAIFFPNIVCVYNMQFRNNISSKRILNVCTLPSRGYINVCLSCFEKLFFESDTV